MILDLLDELVRGIVDQAQQEIPHSHLKTIRVSVREPALPCGSKYFLIFNEEFTLGLDRDDFITLRDQLDLALDKILYDERSATQDSELGLCMVCKKQVDLTSGFGTTAGAMHFDCN